MERELGLSKYWAIISYTYLGSSALTVCTVLHVLNDIFLESLHMFLSPSRRSEKYFIICCQLDLNCFLDTPHFEIRQVP